jgi:hypothetical protein
MLLLKLNLLFLFFGSFELCKTEDIVRFFDLYGQSTEFLNFEILKIMILCNNYVYDQ